MLSRLFYLTMHVFGLTGGIATGKSTAVGMLLELDPKIIVFDADRCVSDLYQTEEVLDEVRCILGKEAVGENGVNRNFVRQQLFDAPELRILVQNLIHPLVRKECLACLEKASNTLSTSSFIADVPLLFEGGFDFGQSANLVVATSAKTQVKRLKMRNGFDDATVQAILAAQLPISHKVNCADVVFWNEGPLALLRAQLKRFIKEISI